MIQTISLGPSASSAPLNLSVASVTSGANTFIKFVNLSGTAVPGLSSISFSIANKTGASAAAISATYSSSYLSAHGYLNVGASTVSVPVYGLYQSYANSVSITYRGRSSGRLSLTVPTESWSNGCNSAYTTQTQIVSRNKNVKLGYSFFMLKGWVCGAHPVVMDVDGEVRWAGTAGDGNQGSSFFRNNFYLGSGSQLYKMALDGTYSVVGDYGAAGYNNFHHNIDFGRDGLLLDLNHNSDVESNILEVNAAGAVLRNWDLGAIFDAAITAGGDNPAGFVKHDGNDWFHNNAATYWPQRNELVVSSRENFVVGIGYDDHKIKWILGDRDKNWYQNYPSLRPYALNLAAGSLPPIGQHAVSITSSGNLMLFDNGTGSFYQSPSGSSRSYSAPRQYQINTRARNFTATEVWNFDHGQTVYSWICSSIYQSGASYLIDYASEGDGIRLVGIDSNKNIGFEYKLPGTQFYYGWNALPIHIENISY